MDVIAIIYYKIIFNHDHNNFTILFSQTLVQNGSHLSGTKSETGEQLQASLKLGEDISTTEIEQDKRYRYQLNAFKRTGFVRNALTGVYFVVIRLQ